MHAMSQHMAKGEMGPAETKKMQGQLEIMKKMEAMGKEGGTSLARWKMQVSKADHAQPFNFFEPQPIPSAPCSRRINRKHKIG